MCAFCTFKVRNNDLNPLYDRSGGMICECGVMTPKYGFYERRVIGGDWSG